jgi:predicted glycosyltransferase involved in capsule biosynthesis
MSNNISIVFPVMNRTNVLLQTVPSWLDSEYCQEVIIVDWSSNIPIYEDESVGHIIRSSKTRVIRVEGEKFFLSPSFSINLGIKKATSDTILKLDIDYKLINPKFMKRLDQIKPKLTNGFFVTDSDLFDQDICLTGFVFMNRKHFYLVDGYNENLRGWGYEDLDMYKRLSSIIDKYLIANLDKFIYHIPHDDNLRRANHIDKEISIGENETLNRQRASLPKSPMSEYNTKYAIFNDDFDSKVPKYEVLERIK